MCLWPHFCHPMHQPGLPILLDFCNQVEEPAVPLAIALVESSEALRGWNRAEVSDRSFVLGEAEDGFRIYEELFVLDPVVKKPKLLCGAKVRLRWMTADARAHGNIGAGGFEQFLVIGVNTGN